MNEQIQYIKNEMISYTYYSNKLNGLKKELEYIVYKLEGVGGIDPSKVRMTSPSNSKENFFQLMEEEEELEKLISNYQARIELIDTMLEGVGEEYAGVMKAIYITKQSTFAKESQKIYRSEAQLKRDIAKQLKKFIKATKM